MRLLPPNCCPQFQLSWNEIIKDSFPLGQDVLCLPFKLEALLREGM